MATPVENLIDKSVTANEKPIDLKDGEVWATHSGIVDLGGIKLTCHVLSNGKRIFDADDIDKFFGLLNEQD